MKSRGSDKEARGLAGLEIGLALYTNICYFRCIVKEGGVMGRTNIELDDRLVEAGLKMTRCKTKKELVHLALKALVAKKSRKRLLDLKGRVTWIGDLSQMRKSRV